MKLRLIIILLLILITGVGIHLRADADCLDNSYYLAVGIDYHEYHEVETCLCDCQKHKRSDDRGKCSKCGHFRVPRDYIIVGRRDAAQAVAERDTPLIPQISMEKFITSYKKKLYPYQAQPVKTTDYSCAVACSRCRN